MIETGEGTGGVFEGGARSCELKFRKRTVLSDWRGRIRTRELEEEVLKDNWAIETGPGVCRREALVAALLVKVVCALSAAHTR